MDTLYHLLEEAAARFPSAIALQGDREGGGRAAYTRPELRARAAALARALLEGGVKPGDPVALLSPNRPEWAAGYFGAALAGAVLVPLDVNLKEGELLNVLRRSGARALVTDGAERERGAALLSSLGGGCPHLRLDEPPALPPPQPEDLPGASRREDDLALLSFSSGTTGVPKGVMLTHRNIVSNVRAVMRPFICGPGDVFLSVLPLHHMFESTAGLLLPIATGATVHYLVSLNPRVLAETMRREEVSICLMVPALLRLMHKRILGTAYSTGGVKGLLFRLLFPLSRALAKAGVRAGGTIFPQARRALSPRLRYLVSGGAALDPQVGWDLLALGIEVIQGYGLTETAPITHANRPGRGNHIGTVGPPIPGVEARLEPVPGGAPGEGEVWIRGPNVMQGYFGNPALTAEVLKDGWFRTGDIGRVDGEGYLTICGRAKNVVVLESGKNVYPEEVEEELAKSALFKEACVIGRRAGRAEEVFAVVVVDPEAPAFQGPKGAEERRREAEREVARLCAGLADYKRVSGVYLWPGDALPRTTTLKHKREEIKEALRRAPGYGPEDF